MQHHLLQLTFDGKLFMSPAGTDKPLHRVLDVGTGTGIWALDFGIRNPNPCPLLSVYFSLTKIPVSRRAPRNPCEPHAAESQL